MKIASNVHVHSSWCDGFNKPEEMAEAAINLNFTDLGFSSHSYTPFDPSTRTISSYDEYVKDISLLKKRYKDKLNILCGIEQDMHSPIDRQLFDYTILSAHYLPLYDGIYTSVDHHPKILEDAIGDRYMNNSIALAKDYFSFLTSGVREHKPDILGHYDVITKSNKEFRFFDENSKEYMDTAITYLDDILDTLNGYGGMIEINTSGIRYKWTGYPYAGTPFMLRRILQKKTRVIITGDSHEIGYLTYGFDEALQLLTAYGFKSMTILENGIFRDISI